MAGTTGILTSMAAAALLAACGGGGGNPGQASNTQQVVQQVAVSTSATALTIHPGDQNVPLMVQVTSSPGNVPITVTLSALPSGISVTPVTLVSGQSGVLYLSASVSADQEAFPADVTLTSTSDSQQSTVNVVAAAGAMLANAQIALTVSLENPSYAPAPASINLPVVSIDTSGVPIVDKTTDVPGTITITSADGTTSYLPNASDADNTATFHLHGESTAYMPKQPYHVKLNTSLDLLNVMGLSCPYVTSSGKAACDKSKTFVLLANYDDKSLLRDWAASALANAIPIGNGYLNSPADSPTPSGTSALMPWAPHSLFVELYLNGVYEGNYQLIEEIKVDSHRVNINELSETDITDDVTGGYLMEIDEEMNETYMWSTPAGISIGLVDPDYSPDPEVPQQTSYITNYVDAAETALFSSSFTDPAVGWRAYFDEASVINFYLVNDIMGNVDGGDFYSSDYFYKDKDNPLLYMGPVWDFDISAGNVNYASIVNPTVSWMRNAPWYAQWFDDPQFLADAASQWNALKANGVLAAWLNAIRQQAASLQQSAANNFGRWPMQGELVVPNAEAAGNYAAEVSYLINWITLRMAYLDSVFNVKAPASITLSVPDVALSAGSAVTLTAQVGGTDPTGTVYLLSNGVIVGMAAVDSGGSASLSPDDLPAGTNALEAVYSGDDRNALATSSSTLVTVEPPLASTVVSLAGSASTISQGASVTFSAAVIANFGTVAPTGTLTFTSNGTALATVALSAGAASFTTQALPVGVDAIEVIYSGDGNYQGASSQAVSVNCN